jgi:hypothetical protein
MHQVLEVGAVLVLVPMDKHIMLVILTTIVGAWLVMVVELELVTDVMVLELVEKLFVVLVHKFQMVLVT